MLFKCAVLFALIVKVLCIDFDLFGDNVGILSDSPFKNIQRDSVKKLDLRGNGIDSISDTAFSGFSKLEILELMKNNLICIPENVFNDMENMNYLGLGDNNIQCIHKNAFSKLRKLKSLSLNDNLISNLQIGVFENNLELDYITLQDNRLTFIPDGVFRHLPKLHTIDLSMNYIHYVNKYAFPPNLHYLYIYANKLQHFDIDGYVLTSLAGFTIDKNPLYCDCNFKPLFQKWKTNFANNGGVPTCEGPKSMRHRSWSELAENDFVCNQNKIEFQLENDGIIPLGQNIVIGCYINHVVSNIRITYKNQKSKNKIYFAQSAWTERGTWYNLTIKNTQINDGGLYKCVVNANEEIVEKKLTLTVLEPHDTCCAV